MGLVYQGTAERSGSPRLHRLAVATALASYLLIVLAGLVRGTALEGTALGRGQGVGAAVVGALTLALAYAFFRARDRSAEVATPRLGWAAVLLVGLQGMLGALSVVVPLPPGIAAVHTGASLFCLLAVFDLAAQTAGTGIDNRTALAPAARRLALVSAIGVLFQALLGALVRTWPASSDSDVLHRLGAATVAVLVFASTIRTFRAAPGRDERWLRTLAVAAALLAAAQISLGVGSVQSVLRTGFVQAHLAVGAALLAASWAVYLLSAPAAVVPAQAFRVRLRALGELSKPRITTMVVVTFAGGLWLAPGSGSGRHLLALLGTVLVVAAANALNMFLERDIDGRMERTRRRPLVEGRLSAEMAVGFGTVLACLALPLLVIGANGLTAALGLIAFVSYVWAYTPLKRISGAALFVGAVPGAMPPLMGWTTATGRLDAPGLALFAILFLWQLPHFLAIALYRAEDYANAGFRVLPMSQGVRATRWHIVVETAALVGASVLPVWFGVAGRIYLAAALILGGWFLARALVGFRAAAPRPWARSVFLVSLVYLTGLFVALAIDHSIG